MMLPRFASTTESVPLTHAVPTHIAIIMDGNGRWARLRHRPRVSGHVRGVESVRAIIRACIERGVRYLTLFAFSSENWRRPWEEVSFLMQLFMKALKNEVKKLHENKVRFRVVGDLSRFDPKLTRLIAEAEQLTADNTALTLTVAANYGGRWDILQAVEKMLALEPQKRAGFQEADLASHLSMASCPEPDLFIRTGGEKRISNFLLWQLAYTELYFTDTLWPDFDAAALDHALDSYAKRERRFGRTSEQVANAASTGVPPHA
jgi:undecaprenyl diphosphate synthase